MALSSIAHSKMRSFLTMLGIIIGVSSVITVLAVGEGIKQQIVGESETLGSNLINITPGQTFGADGNSFNPTASVGASTLSEEDVETIRSLDTIEAAAPIALISGIPNHGGSPISGVTIMSTDADLAKVLNLGFASGAFLTQADDEAEGIGSDETATTEESVGEVNEIVLGYRAAEQIFTEEPTRAMGEIITFREQQFRVIGILEEPADGFMFSMEGQLSSSMFIPFEVGKDIAGGVANIIEINATATSTEVLDDTVEEIKAVITANHGGEEDFTVLTQEQFVEVFDTIFGSVAAFIAAIAGISLLVGGIGVANIMLVSVTERTREIGIRKAVGANRFHIMMQFLIEAIVLSLVGGALGVAMAFGMTSVIAAQADISAIFTPFAFILALGVSIGVGVIFGIAPAIKAARKDPIQALRYE
ncbi:MAG: ABC transporter permease [Candidatus Saccharimonadales bacterium]